MNQEIEIGWDSSVGVAKDYGLDRRDSNPGRSRDFSLLYSIQTSSWVHPTSYPVTTRSSFPGGKAANE
jgi:hypothetical protein